MLASLRQRRIKPGSELIREWAGTVHRVVVVNGGYAYLGQTYRSLSEIARLITGTLERPPVLRAAGASTSA